MQFPTTGKPSLGVIYDSSLGSNADEALTLALLYGLDGKNDCRVIAISTTRDSLRGAQLCDVIGRFLAGSISGFFGNISRALPIGMSVEGKLQEDTPIIKQVLARPEFKSPIAHLNDTAEVTPLLRNALTAQEDKNAAVVLNGPATNLAALLALPGAIDWIKSKVRHLAVAMPEAAVAIDPTAARKLFAEWPTPIFVADSAVGDALRYPGASIEKDFAWATPAHPVVDAYKAAGTMPYDAPAPGMAAALQAVHPDKGYFTLSDPGTFTIDDSGKLRFKPSAEGRHRAILPNDAKREEVLALYTQMASAKPVQRTFRRRSEAQQEQQQKKNTPAPKPESK
ncbi:MAG: hypothetical protein JNK87_15620 [Bryobacterales bacterium]|nr:hypothetical protein [Bryobacterales bacterium]